MKSKKKIRQHLYVSNFVNLFVCLVARNKGDAAHEQGTKCFQISQANQIIMEISTITTKMQMTKNQSSKKSKS